MIVGRWNYEKDNYEPYVIPDDWHTPLYTDDLTEEVNCASCGRKLMYGKTYVSMEIHVGLGFGYPVCSDCYSEEKKRRIDSWED